MSICNRVPVLLIVISFLMACSAVDIETRTATSTLVSQPSNTPSPRPPAAALDSSPTATPTLLPPPTATPMPPTATPTPPLSATPSPSPTIEPSPTSPPSPSPQAEPPPIRLEWLVDGLDSPVYLTHAGDDSGRLFVVERHGKVRVIQDGVLLLESFLDIDSLVGSDSNEQGLLSMAFHPNFTENRRLFINYTDNDGDTVIARYQTGSDLQTVDPATAKTILTIDQPFRNHNGGQLQFGPDGHLYIGTGDGGSANDPAGNGQNGSVLLGKMLRINVDLADPYAVPADNPFVGDAAVRPELWATGLRNPWRFSFDRLTGDLYIADVGQNQYEEVDVELASSPGGLNFGWDVMEGFHCFTNRNCDQTGLVSPIAEYDHQDGNCSITGGYVYRGVRQPALDGLYFYGDFCSGNIWGLRLGGEPALLLQTDLSISSFGEDEAGELYVVDLRGGIYQVMAK